MKHIEVFPLIDTREDGSVKSISYFSDVEQAWKVKDKSGLRGMTVGDNTSLIIFDTAEEYYTNQDAELRKAALSKLSAEERRVLGLGSF